MPKYRVVATYLIKVDEIIEAKTEEIALSRRRSPEDIYEGKEWGALADAEFESVTICEETEDA